MTISWSRFREFIPKSFVCLSKGYLLHSFKKDLFAGITVGIIALPLSMAFAIASGVGPERGLYTAIIAGFLISLLGGSRVQIGGPTGAFVGIIYEIVQRTGYEGLCISTLIGAFRLILLGLFRIGSWIKYVPHPLVVGFTTGLAFVIFSTQVKDFFGLQMGPPPADFIEKWMACIEAFPTFDPTTLFVSIGTLFFILAMRRWCPSAPWGVTAIVVATLVCQLCDLPIETIESHFGMIPHQIPIPSFPDLNIPDGMLKELFVDGITIAFLGGVESLLSAVIGDGMIGSRHRSNGELVAQGLANIGSVFFGGIPATGAIARTVVNVKSGAQTPVAGMIHAVVLILILYCLAPFVSLIPLSALAAVLVMVAWNMSELNHFFRLFKSSASDRMVLFTAFSLTVFVDITVAISAGMILASLLFMKEMSQRSKVVPLSQMFAENQNGFRDQDDVDVISKKSVPAGVEVYEIQGPLFFGAANLLRDLIRQSLSPPKIFILQMRAVPMIDASGMYGLEEFYDQCKKNNTLLFLSGVHGQTRKDLKKFGLLGAIGESRLFPNIDLALESASKYL